MGRRDVVGRPMVMIKEMIRLQRGDEEVTAERTTVEQHAEVSSFTIAAFRCVIRLFLQDRFFSIFLGLGLLDGKPPQIHFLGGLRGP